MPKMTLAMRSMPPTTRLRSAGASIEVAAATRMASTSTRRISFSTNGPKKLSGSRVSWMNPSAPPSLPPSAMSACASASVEGSGGIGGKPAPGLTMLTTISPSPSASSVMSRKYASARAAIPPAAARLPIEAMPTITVQKMTGAVIILMSWMKMSGRNFRSEAKSGATRPTIDAGRDAHHHPEPELGPDPAPPGASGAPSGARRGPRVRCLRRHRRLLCPGGGVRLTWQVRLRRV